MAISKNDIIGQLEGQPWFEDYLERRVLAVLRDQEDADREIETVNTAHALHKTVREPKALTIVANTEDDERPTSFKELSGDQRQDLHDWMREQGMKHPYVSSHVSMAVIAQWLDSLS